MKKYGSTVILILVFLIGLSLLLYPTVSDHWNSYHQSQAIATYAQEVAELDEDRYNELWGVARAYNDSLAENPNPYVMTDEQKESYDKLLNVGGDGVMGYIEIPSIQCYLPIYHGTDEAVLQVAVGHLEWTSLPVGGEGSHCVLSGHRGLPSASLFTDLDELVVGDIFLLRVLDEMFTYEVDQILIVEPNDTQALMIEAGEDYCTLVTCTPYGINSHRLLVRGHRIENLSISKTVYVTADAMQIDPILVAPIIALPILLLLFVYLLIRYRKK